MGWDLSLLTAATDGHIVHLPHDLSLESEVGIILTGETEELREKPGPVTLCPPQIPHKLTRAQTWAYTVRD
jgi:hypothetical protein